MKLLYIEDEQTIAIPVIKVLEKKGYTVEYCESGKEGLHNALVNAYDCIILDLHLPEIDGIEITKSLKRSEISTPVLMLTARTSLKNKLDGFQVGADDYVTKPFEILELIARIEALVRRNSANKAMELILGEFVVHADKNELVHIKSNKITQLSNKEAGVLEYMVRNEGRVISTEELLEHVWDTNINTFTETVKTHIKTIRKKLGKDAILIRTINGKGYVYEKRLKVKGSRTKI